MRFGNLKKSFNIFWSKFWFLLWKDDSFKGWILSIIILFILIKFIFFPFLSLVSGTELPLAIVESCSMYHDGNLFSNYDNWWSRHEKKYFYFNISKNEFKDFIFKNGFNKGDIFLVTGANIDKLKVGDVIIFNVNYKNPVIHRIIKIKEKNNKRIFETIGDNNNGQLVFEKNIIPNQIIGRARFKVAPYFGWIKLIFFESFKSKSERGFCKEN